MITLTDYQLARLADHFSKSMTNEERFKVKYNKDGTPRYHLTHGILGKVLLKFDDPVYETAFRLRFSEFLTTQRPLPHIVIQPTFTDRTNDSSRSISNRKNKQKGQ